VNRAGGFFYHLRARAAGARWQPFRDALGEWLRGAFVNAPTSLVLVGPSAAYCLEDAFLSRFQSITVFEPDPVARFLLGRRVRRLGVRRLELVHADHLVEPLSSGGRGLDAVLDERPDDAVLFSNVLGQVRFLLPEERLDKWQRGWTERIVPRLRGRTWASFHDRVSASVAPELTMPYRAPARVSDPDLGPLFYANASGRVELLDHLTAGLFPRDLPYAYLHWALGPGAHHLVEAVGERGRAAK
jgi:hypothetical protein